MEAIRRKRLVCSGSIHPGGLWNAEVGKRTGFEG